MRRAGDLARIVWVHGVPYECENKWSEIRLPPNGNWGPAKAAMDNKIVKQMMSQRSLSRANLGQVSVIPVGHDGAS